MSLREDGYFEQVSAQLESTVGAQFSDVTDSASENAESGVSPSVNALDVGIKAATAIGSLPDNVAEATILPVIGALGIKGQACLPIAKQLDPVIGIDIHLVTMPPSPGCSYATSLCRDAAKAARFSCSIHSDIYSTQIASAEK